MNRVSKVVNIGGFSHVKAVPIGGRNPVVVQTMWKEKLYFADLDGAVLRIEALEKLGCSLLRFAVPDLQAAELVGRLAQMVTMPLVADIHFDYKIALRCLDFPVAKIRINPGNIGGKDKIRAVLEKAAAGKIPVRIGVNAGSLPQDLRLRVNEGIKVRETAPSGLVWGTAQALAEAAERELAVFDEFGFDNVLVSMKASTIADTINANKILGSKVSVPLHLGVTEAGPLTAGVARNSAALLTLLTEGIGDTIRVSLSDSMENEIIAGREIIRAARETAGGERLKTGGVKIVSCPRCGRYGFDTHSFTARWMPKLYSLDKDITVAIMGCEVNGPEEARNADIGITGAGEKILIFKQGKIIKTIHSSEADTVFEEELNKL